MKTNTLEPEFVEYMPEVLEDGTLYVSMRYATVMHNCCCGCGNKVVTPLTPTDWKLMFNGETVGLSPSIGNWNFPCESHYWIQEGRVEWADKWTKEQIQFGRDKDKVNKKRHFQQQSKPGNKDDKQVSVNTPQASPSFMSWLLQLFK